MTHTTPKHSIPDAGQLLMEGIYLRTEAKRRETAETGGVFRGASTGLLLPDGAVTGKCVREAAARFLGAEPPRDPSEWNHKQLMFDAGFANEDSWYEPMKLVWPGKILREEEFPIKWEVDGVAGTGREDFILCDTAGKPILLLEMKNVSSLNTLITVLLKGMPKMDAAIQCGNYMLRSGLPGQIYYTNRFDCPIPPWKFLQPMLPKGPEDTRHPAVRYCEWTAGASARPRKDGRGWTKGLPPEVKKIKPFIVGFNLRWNRGVLEWRSTAAPSTAKWNPSPITSEGLDGFGRAVTTMLRDEVLPPPPVNVEIDGSVVDRFHRCSWCDWQSVCRTGPEFANAEPATYAEWRAAVDQQKAEALEIEPVSVQATSDVSVKE